MKVLITGGAGYVGSVLAPMLKEWSGHEITIYDKMIFGNHQTEMFETIQGDIMDIKPRDLDGFDAVIHLAGVSNDPTAEFNPDHSLVIARKGTGRLAQSAINAGVNRFIFASSCSVYYTEQPTDRRWKEDDSVNPRATYSRGKRDAEIILMELSAKYDSFCQVILRKGTIFGQSPRMRYDLVLNAFCHDAFYKNRLTVHAGGRALRPMLDIRDACRAYQWTLEAPAEKIKGEIINVSTFESQVLNLAKTVRERIRLDTGGKIIPEIDIHETGPTRSYTVNTEKIKTLYGPTFGNEFYLEDSIREMMDELSEYLGDPDDPRFYNIRWMELAREWEQRLHEMGGSIF